MKIRLSSRRLRSEQRLWSLHSKNAWPEPQGCPPVHDDLVLRDFTATELVQLWLPGITERGTDKGKLYLCSIRIVGSSVDSKMTAELAVAAIRNAASLREPAGTTLNSDRGSQVHSRKLIEQIEEFGITGSMGRVRACAVNAAMESFLSLLRKNVLNRQRWHSRQELRLAIVTWIVRTYRRRKRRRRPGRLSPIEFEIFKSHAAHTA